MSYLLDTEVVSELRKGERADPGVRAWLAGVGDDELHLSVLVVGELRRGVERLRRRDAAAATALDGWLRRVLALHRDRILPVDLDVAEAWAILGVPGPLPVVDGLLAATAHVHGLTLVTRNVHDVRGTGVPCHDPFRG